MHSHVFTFTFLSLFVFIAFGVSARRVLTNRPLHFKECTKPAEPGVPPSDSFCSNPPTAPVNLNVYKGTWFQIFGSGSARQLTRDQCVTANYKLNKNNTVAVLNCSVRDGRELPSCTTGIASQRPGTTDPGKLQVFFPTLPTAPFNPGSYNVAALVGNEKIGYLAAAVYTCTKFPDGTKGDGFFILSRTTLLKHSILQLLTVQLECKGYDVSQVFEPVEQNDCRYFFQEKGSTTTR